jgi:hypothetical protein
MKHSSIKGNAKDTKGTEKEYEFISVDEEISQGCINPIIRIPKF